MTVHVRHARITLAFQVMVENALKVSAVIHKSLQNKVCVMTVIVILEHKEMGEPVLLIHAMVNRSC